MIKRLCLKPLELMMAEIGERADIRHLLFFFKNVGCHFKNRNNFSLIDDGKFSKRIF